MPARNRHRLPRSKAGAVEEAAAVAGCRMRSLVLLALLGLLSACAPCDAGVDRACPLPAPGPPTENDGGGGM